MKLSDMWIRYDRSIRIRKYSSIVIFADLKALSDLKALDKPKRPQLSDFTVFAGS